MKPTIPDVVERFSEYVRNHPNGGSLHIVLEDGNIDTESVMWCINYASVHGDVEGEALGRVLLTMSKTQRNKLPYKLRTGFYQIDAMKGKQWNY